MFLRKLRRPALLSLALAALLLGWGGIGGHTGRASADTWCWDDPVITINGQQVTMLVGVSGPQATVAGVTATVTVYVPAGVSTRVIVPPALSPFKETLSFVTQETRSYGGVKAMVVVSFSSPAPLATALQVTYPNGRTGLFSGNTAGALITGFTVN